MVVGVRFCAFCPFDAAVLKDLLGTTNVGYSMIDIYEILRVNKDFNQFAKPTKLWRILPVEPVAE